MLGFTHIRSRRARQRGGSVLEAAIVFNILLLFIIFPAMEFGYLFYLTHTLSGASREGARQAIVANATTTEVNQAIARALNSAGLQASSTVIDASKFTVEPYNVNVATGQPITIDVRSTWGQIGIKPSIFLQNSKQIRGVAVMRKEG